jgi:hypothetical protein
MSKYYHKHSEQGNHGPRGGAMTPLKSCVDINAITMPGDDTNESPNDDAAKKMPFLEMQDSAAKKMPFLEMQDSSPQLTEDVSEDERTAHQEERCQFCRPFGRDPRCFLDRMNGDYSLACDEVTMEISGGPRDVGQYGAVMRNCRYKLYHHHMALRCLFPLADGQRKQLPTCVVRDIQSTFPDPGGLHAESELVINFYRPWNNPSMLVLEAEPARWIFEYSW